MCSSLRIYEQGTYIIIVSLNYQATCITNLKCASLNYLKLREKLQETHVLLFIKIIENFEYVNIGVDVFIIINILFIEIVINIHIITMI